MLERLLVTHDLSHDFQELACVLSLYKRFCSTLITWNIIVGLDIRVVVFVVLDVVSPRRPATVDWWGECSDEHLLSIFDIDDGCMVDSVTPFLHVERRTIPTMAVSCRK